jgi:hypothetical protein
MAGEMLTGILGGAGTGATVGSVAGPWGTAIGAIGGAIAGGISTGKQLSARDDAMERLEALPMYDPMQLGFLDQLKREKRAVESGYTTDFQVAKDLQKEAMAGGLSVAESVGEVNPALAISMVKGVSQGFSSGVNKSLGTIATKGMGYTQSIGELINLISQRALDVESHKVMQELGLATSDLQTSQTNAAQFAARLPQYADDFSTVAGQIGGWGGGSGATITGPGISPQFASTMEKKAIGQVSPAVNFMPGPLPI